MSRTAFTKISAVTNDGAAITSTALTNGATGTDGYELTDCAKDDRLVLVVENTGSATGSFWVEYGQMNNADQGQLAVVVGGGLKKSIGPLEGARFKQSDGDIYMSSGFTGAVFALEV